MKMGEKLMQTEPSSNFKRGNDVGTVVLLRLTFSLFLCFAAKFQFRPYIKGGSSNAERVVA
jgi:hypothetical protein